jgi:tartrate-resistant acid phosphatase type 5
MIRALLVALSLAAGFAPQQATPPPASTPPAVTFVEALAAKLPPEWRAPLALLTFREAQQAQLLALSGDALRQNLARQLVRVPAADEFVRTLLKTDPAPRVRSAIVSAIASDARWAASVETVRLLEGVVASDPNVAVSLGALDILRRSKIRGLALLVASRLTAARAAGDAAAVTRLIDEHERWITLERGTMLPAFLREPPPVFSVLPPERTVRVMAFGDFGTGTPAQMRMGQTLAAYHREKPFDLAITLGDNFYSVGMESPADPRWQTWFEEVYGPLGITFYAALGNHDWGHPDSPAAEILYRSAKNSWRMPASYYTFTAGPVQFFALDTQNVAASEKQVAWLDAELSRSKATWKVVYGHHPIYSAGNYLDRPDLIEKLMPVLRNRADMYICGHDHNLQSLMPDGGVRFFVAGGGGAGLYTIRPHDRTLFASSSHGFAVLDAGPTELTVSLVDVAGKTVHQEVLRKSAVTSPAR